MRQTLTAIIAFAICGISLLSRAHAQNVDVAVAVNKENLVTSLSTTDLRMIFLGRRHDWPGAVPVRLFVRGPGAHERTVLLTLLSMSESDYKKHWTVQVFRGDAQAEPVALPSNGIQKEAIVTYASYCPR
jgi:hypothetical protein